MSNQSSRNRSVLQRYNSYMVRSRKGFGTIELITGLEISEDDWEFCDYIDENDPVDKLLILVPMYDWGETCPKCEVGWIEDEYNHCAGFLMCTNCGFLTPWRYGSYKWQQGKPREISKLSVQKLFEEEEDF